MTSTLETSRDHFIEGVSRIARFWGFPKAMGAIYGAVYLSPDPLTLDDLVRQVGVSKGAVSTNVRTLQRLQMIHKRVKVGDRKDYYEIAPGAFETMMAKRVGVIHAMAGLAAEGVQAVGEEPSAARNRLTEMLDFYLFMGEQIEQLLERWREVKG